MQTREWDFILDRRGALCRRTGHLVVVPVLIDGTLLATVGLSHHEPLSAR